MKEPTEASTHRKLIRPSLTEVREQQKRVQEEQQRLAEQRMQERRQQQQRPPEPRPPEPRPPEQRAPEQRPPEPRQQDARPQERRQGDHRQQDNRQQDNRRGEHRPHDKRRPEGRPPEGRPPEKRPQPEAKPKRSVPPDQTNAENFYYVKQMQNRTPIAVVLRDGEELRGYIEWYDRHSIKLNRAGEPNVMVYKANIKYIFKLNDKPAAGAAQGEGAEKPDGGDAAAPGEANKPEADGGEAAAEE
jgi:sRNA-binding regulator protein Hfq